MRVFQFTFSLALATAALVACAPGPKQPAPGGTLGFEPERSVEDPTWRPERVTVTCGTTACPPQVGITMYVTAVRDARGQITKFETARCTATLIGMNRVLTNRHCVEAGADGYFILPGGHRRVRDVAFERFAGLDEASRVIVGPDVAVLTLDRAFDEVTPLPVASGVLTDTNLTAFVGNAAAEANTYRIDRVTCSVGPTPKFPFDPRENPDILFSFDCRIVKGNSGGPMFASGQPAVQAIVQAFGTNSVLATNLHCLPLTPAGAAPCVTADADEFARRLGLDAKGAAAPVVPAVRPTVARPSPAGGA